MQLALARRLWSSAGRAAVAESSSWPWQLDVDERAAPWDGGAGPCPAVLVRSEVSGVRGFAGASPKLCRVSPGDPPAQQSFTAVGNPGHRQRGSEAPGGQLGSPGALGAAALGAGRDIVAWCASQHRQDTRITTKTRMKCKEQIYFHYLVNWGIPQAAPRQKHTSGNAGAVKLSPC